MVDNIRYVYCTGNTDGDNILHVCYYTNQYTGNTDCLITYDMYTVPEILMVDIILHVYCTGSIDGPEQTRVNTS